MAEFKVSIKGMEKFIKTLKQAPDIVMNEADDAIQSISRLIQTHARQEAPRDTGLLANQIQYERLGIAKAEVISKAEYSEDVHEGRPPGRITDTRPLERWGKRHGFANTNLLIDRIERSGTAPNPFLKRALAESERFMEVHLKKANDRMVERLSI